MLMTLQASVRMKSAQRVLTCHAVVVVISAVSVIVVTGAVVVIH